MREIEHFEYGTHFEYALLCRQVYKDVGEIKTGERSEKHEKLEGWKTITVTYDEGSDFGAAIYSHLKKREIIVTIQGTRPESLKNWTTDTLLAFPKMEEWYKSIADASASVSLSNVLDLAEKFYADNSSVFPEGFTIKFAGHSLGATIAEIMACQYRKPAVTFESPGCKEILERMSISSEDVDIIGYVAAPNLVNTCHTHVGELRRLYIPHTDGVRTTYALKCFFGSANRIVTYASLGTGAAKALVYTSGKLGMSTAVGTATKSVGTAVAESAVVKSSYTTLANAASTVAAKAPSTTKALQGIATLGTGAVAKLSSLYPANRGNDNSNSNSNSSKDYADDSTHPILDEGEITTSRSDEVREYKLVVKRCENESNLITLKEGVQDREQGENVIVFLLAYVQSEERWYLYGRDSQSRLCDGPITEGRLKEKLDLLRNVESEVSEDEKSEILDIIKAESSTQSSSLAGFLTSGRMALFAASSAAVSSFSSFISNAGHLLDQHAIGNIVEHFSEETGMPQVPYSLVISWPTRTEKSIKRFLAEAAKSYVPFHPSNAGLHTLLKENEVRERAVKHIKGYGVEIIDYEDMQYERHSADFLEMRYNP